MKTNDVHPTMKPLPLIEYVIKNSSKYKALIAAPFFGSGTTIFAADKTDRVYQELKLDPKYYQIIAENI